MVGLTWNASAAALPSWRIKDKIANDIARHEPTVRLRTSGRAPTIHCVPTRNTFAWPAVGAEQGRRQADERHQPAACPSSDTFGQQRPVGGDVRSVLHVHTVYLAVSASMCCALPLPVTGE